MRVMYFSMSDSPIGKLVIATEGEKLCALGMAENAHAAEVWLRKVLRPAAPFQIAYKDNLPQHAQIARAALAFCRGEPVALPEMVLYGTDFQQKVWRALLEIPLGSVVSYRDVAQKIGNPKAVRAVGTAVGANPITLFVPCHRVIGSSGGLHGYGWGLPTKKRLLQAEGCLAA